MLNILGSLVPSAHLLLANQLPPVMNYIYRNKFTFSEISRYNYHYDGFPEDVISKGLDGEIESMMVEGMGEAMATANILLDNLKNDFESDS